MQEKYHKKERRSFRVPFFMEKMFVFLWEKNRMTALESLSQVIPQAAADSGVA